MIDPTRRMPPSEPKPPPGNVIVRIFRLMGPGVITGAADDDPSGIATYSIAGAQLGTSLLWTSLVTWPLMGAVQMMCARIGMVTGEGLASGLRRRIPRWICVVFVIALLLANTINVGADLAGMADAAELLTGWNSHVFVIAFGAVIAFVTVRFRYHQIAQVLKWLVLSLGAYVLTAFIARPDWSGVLHDTLVPHWPADRAAWGMIVAILGTTAGPHLFFWQAAQEVEEEKAKGRRMIVKRFGATANEILNRQIDVGLGTFFSNVVMFFVILSCAATLHRHGITQISTTKEAAEALRPLAGILCHLALYPGLIGVGCLGDLDPRRFRGVCVRRDLSIGPEGSTSRKGGSPRILRRSDGVDRERDRDEFPENFADQGTVLDCGHQWTPGSVSAGRHLFGRDRCETHEAPNELRPESGVVVLLTIFAMFGAGVALFVV